jgi:phosphatidylglycerophosphate synthase
MREMSINQVTGLPDRTSATMRLAANGLSLGRALFGMGLVPYLASSPDYRSAGLATAVAAACATDSADGWLARKAAERLRSATTAFGKWADQICDKFFMHGIFMGVGANELVHGGNAWAKTYGAIILASDFYLTRRDWSMTNVRRELDSRGLEIKARPWGKRKAALGMTTLTVAVSPLAEQAEWKTAVVAGTLGTVGLAAYSLHEMAATLDAPLPAPSAAEETA